MPTKPTQGNDGAIRSQKDRRYPDTFFDQHKSARFPNGRPWWGEREFLSGSQNPSLLDPFLQGELGKGNHEVAGEEWDAPWVPLWNGGSNSFYEFDYYRKRVKIRYDRIIGYDKAEQDRYYMAAAKIAAANGWAEVKYGRTPTYQVISVIGTPPQSPKIAQAAQAGDPWLLGLTDEPNDELAALLGITTSGLRAAPSMVAPLTPDKVLATTSNEDLIKLIANVVTATLDARESAKKAAASERMAHARSHKGKKTEAGSVAA